MMGMAQTSQQGSAHTLEIHPGKASTILNLGDAGIGPALTWLIFPIILSLAITHQSLWIDEGFTVWFASHRSFHSFFTALVGSPNAPGDPQFIFYLLHVWAWIKLFGASELSLRAANIPFAVIFLGTMVWASRRLFWHPNLWVLFCLSPFFCFYLNEARPYVALVAFSSLATVALLAYLIDPERYHSTAPWCCFAGLLLAWGTHILAAFLFPSFIMLAAATNGGNAKSMSSFRRDWCRPALCCSPAFLALGTFHVWTSLNGVSKQDGNPGFANLAYALYEFSGFAGLGPPRNEIREHLNVAVFAPYWPWLLLGVLPLLALVFSFFRSKPPKLFWNLLLSLVLGLAIAFAVCKIEHFQVLGRHLAAFFPLLLMLVMVPPKIPSAPNSSRSLTIAVIAVGVAWGISDLRLVLMSRYAKDPYREACSIALATAHRDGAKVVWAADTFTARYYGIAAAAPNNRPSEMSPHDGIDWPVLDRAVDPQNWSLGQAQAYLDASPVPIILVLSKANPFDEKGIWRSLIQRREPAEIARLNVFSVYEWQPK